MSSVRFHRSIYFPAAVNEGVDAFADFGRLTVDDSGGDYIDVHVDAADPASEDDLVGAFMNYVLGASIHAHQAQSG